MMPALPSELIGQSHPLPILIKNALCLLPDLPNQICPPFSRPDISLVLLRRGKETLADFSRVWYFAWYRVEFESPQQTTYA